MKFSTSSGNFEEKLNDYLSEKYLPEIYEKQNLEKLECVN